MSATLGDDELTWDNTTRIPGDRAVARIRELHETDGGFGARSFVHLRMEARAWIGTKGRFNPPPFRSC